MATSKLRKSHHTGTVKRSIIINTQKDKVWRKISNIVALPTWVTNVKKTVFLSKTRRGIGAVRKITFEDGNTIEEHVVSWENKKSFSYVAVDGLPLRAYVATILIEPVSRKSIRLSWRSYLNSKKMTKKQFTEFLAFMGSFYDASLENLKIILEK